MRPFVKKIFSSKKGSILIYSLLVLTAVITISITLIRLFIPKFRITREAISSIVALYAADSAMEWCLFSNRNIDLDPPVPPQPVFSISTSTLQVTYQIFRGNVVSVCPTGESLNYRTVGSYRRISRSLEISQ